jgi:hypothetical protein
MPLIVPCTCVALGIVEHLAAARLAVAHRIVNHLPIFFERRVQHIADLHVPAFADDRDNRCLGIEQGLQAGVLLRSNTFAARHAERGNLCMLERQLAHFSKIFEVLGIREGVAAFDVVHAQLIQAAGDE